MAGRLRTLAGFFSSPADAWLALRTIAWMAVLPVLKRTVRFPALVHFMWRPGDNRGRRPDREEHVALTVKRLTRQSGGNCLERSLILYRLLSRANADPQLVVGMGKQGEFLGHVWVVVDGQPLLEPAEALGTYREVVRFGAEGQRTEGG